MKLSFPEIKVERSTEFQSQGFDIGNKRIILEILRGKMYSNPIQTICQEIMSNARDAHREVGKHNVPIEVKLPSKLDPTFWIRDFGPGISPDRMADVFIRYGNSTKRDDNTQTGGFGLGSKSPFSYSDTFTIVTVTPENGKFIKRQYLAHIDESGLGQMSCAFEAETDDPQGTTIIITPKPQDFDSFKKFTQQTANHWNVKPTVLGDPGWFWAKYEVAFKGEEWEIHHDSPVGNAPFALIDGIPYRLNLNHIFPAGLRNDMRDLAFTPLRLLFNIGEIPVTANREDLDYQPETIRRLQQKIEKTLHEFRKQLATELENQPNLYKAILLVQELSRKPYGSFLSTVKWKDIEVLRSNNLEIPARTGIRLTVYRRDTSTRAGCRKQSTYNNSVAIKKDTLLVEDDTKKIVTSYARLATLFDKYPDIRYIAVVNPSLEEKSYVDEASKETKYKVVVAEEKIIKDRKDLLEKNHNWNLFGPIKLSQIAKKRLLVDPAQSASKKPAQKIKKLIMDTWVPAEPADYNQKTVKFYVVVSGATTFIDFSKNKKRSIRDFSYLFEHLKTLNADIDLLFGVIPSHVPSLDKTWKPLITYLSEVFEEKNKLTIGSLDSPNSAQYSLPSAAHLLKQSFIERLSADSLLREYLARSLKLKDDRQLFTAFNYLAAILDKPIIVRPPNEALRELSDKVRAKYPLVFLIHYNLTSEALDDLVAYANIKDKDSKDSK